MQITWHRTSDNTWSAAHGQYAMDVVDGKSGITWAVWHDMTGDFINAGTAPHVDDAMRWAEQALASALQPTKEYNPMQITPEVKAELERRGWRRSDTALGLQRWMKNGDDNTRVYPDDDSATGMMANIAEFYSIADGYRLVKEEVAAKMLPLVNARIVYYETHNDGDFSELRKKQWMALASALSPKEEDKPDASL